MGSLANLLSCFLALHRVVFALHFLFLFLFMTYFFSLCKCCANIAQIDDSQAFFKRKINIVNFHIITKMQVSLI